MTRVVAVTCSALRWPGLALVAGIALQGCEAQGSGAATISGDAADQPAAELPSGAVRIGEDLYQVPIGEDDHGCPRYRLYSPTRLVALVIYYRDRAGRFTTDRQQAACASGAPE